MLTQVNTLPGVKLWHDPCVATSVPTLGAANVGMGLACVATSVPTLEASQVGTSLAWDATSVPMLADARVGMRIACVCQCSTHVAHLSKQTLCQHSPTEEYLRNLKILEISWIIQKVLDSSNQMITMGTRCNKHITQQKDTQDEITTS